jgi:hypothetical protein
MSRSGSQLGDATRPPRRPAAAPGAPARYPVRSTRSSARVVPGRVLVGEAGRGLFRGVHAESQGPARGHIRGLTDGPPARGNTIQAIIGVQAASLLPAVEPPQSAPEPWVTNRTAGHRRRCSPMASRLALPGPGALPDEVRSMLSGYRSGARMTAWSPTARIRASGPTTLPTAARPWPATRSAHAAAQRRRPRPQLAHQQPRRAQPWGRPRHGRLGRRAANRGVRAPGPDDGRPARRDRLWGGQPEPGRRPLLRRRLGQADRGWRCSGGSCW